MKAVVASIGVFVFLFAGIFAGSQVNYDHAGIAMGSVLRSIAHHIGWEPAAPHHAHALRIEIPET